MKKYICLSLLTLLVGTASAQEVFDLLRNSTTEIHGTARAVSMANAFGALGGDITAIGINPAGIGIYRHSEASYSQQLGFNTNETDFYGTVTSDRKVYTMPASFGFVESYVSDDNNDGIANFNWSITYNRYNNYYYNTPLEGCDRAVSLLDNINVTQETINQGMNLPYMAYNAYLFNPDASGNYRSILQDGQRVDNAMYQTESGFAQEWNFSFGLNYNYWLYFGASLKVQTLRYLSETCYEEYLGTPEYQLTNQLETRGTGVGFNVGVIVRPIPALRLGLAYHSPTFFHMVDYTQTTMRSYAIADEQGNLRSYTVGSDYESYGYRQETPHEIVFSAAAQIGMVGFISADFQATTYNTTMMRDENNKPYTDVNQDVRDMLRTQYQARIGFECRFTEKFSGRLGYAYTSSPVNSAVEAENWYVYTPSLAPHYTLPLDTHSLTAGLGWRLGESMFLDFALMDNLSKSHFYPFYNSSELGDANAATVSSSRITLTGTIGFRF